MPDLLTGRAWIYISWDPSGVVTAAVQSMLRRHLLAMPVRLILRRATTPEGVAQSVDLRDISLALWVLSDDRNVPAVCSALQQIQRSAQPPLCLAYAPGPTAETHLALLEAGASQVFSHLATLERCMPRILSCAPPARQYQHALTAGLVDRLPFA